MLLKHALGSGPVRAASRDSLTVYLDTDMRRLARAADGDKPERTPRCHAKMPKTWNLEFLSLPQLAAVAARNVTGMSWNEAEAYLTLVEERKAVPVLREWNETIVWISPDENELAIYWLEDVLGQPLSRREWNALSRYLDALELVDCEFDDALTLYGPSKRAFVYLLP